MSKLFSILPRLIVMTDDIITILLKHLVYQISWKIITQFFMLKNGCINYTTYEYQEDYHIRTIKETFEDSLLNYLFYMCVCIDKYAHTFILYNYLSRTFIIIEILFP